MPKSQTRRVVEHQHLQLHTVPNSLITLKSMFIWLIHDVSALVFVQLLYSQTTFLWIYP